MRTIIGLEIHAHLKTKSKMFCKTPVAVGNTSPNTNVCPICMGHPGTLPVPNRKAVELVIKTGLALNSKISTFSKFDRKNYFYPDLPKGYQISQYDKPLCEGGFLEIEIDGKKKKISLIRIHLEEDAGKLVHPKGGRYSLVDFNRAGTPLMEIVTKPVLESPKEAKIFMQKLQNILRDLDVSIADMEKGQMRCDANINIASNNRKTAISEVKNMNSFRSVERALLFEQERHKAILKEGKEKDMVKETRGWDDVKGVTISQRTKEEAHDYRYFPEPDIPPMAFSQDEIEKIRRSIPELAENREARFKSEYGLSKYDASLLSKDIATSAFFEDTVSELEGWMEGEGEVKEKDADKYRFQFAKLAANWILSELYGLIKGDKLDFANIKISPENMAELIKIVFKKEISTNVGQKVLLEMYKTNVDPSQYIEREGLKQVSGDKEIEQIVDRVINDNPKPTMDYREGNKNALQFLVGQVMKESRGKANPEKAREILKEKLN